MASDFLPACDALQSIEQKESSEDALAPDVLVSEEEAATTEKFSSIPSPELAVAPVSAVTENMAAEESPQARVGETVVLDAPAPGAEPEVVEFSAAESEALKVRAPVDEEQGAEVTQTPAEEVTPTPSEEQEKQEERKVVAEPVAVTAAGGGKKKALSLLRPRYKVLSVSLALLLLALVIVPALFLVNMGLTAYSTYKHVHDTAYDGYHHFLNLKPVLSAVKEHPSSAMTPATLNQVAKELTAARSDFAQVQNTLQYASIIHTITNYFPQYQAQITAVSRASRIGVDVADIGLQVIGLGKSLAPRLQGPLLSNSSTPLITFADIEQIRLTLDTLEPLLQDIQIQRQGLDLAVLPITESQRLQAVNYLDQLPLLQSYLAQSDTWLDAASWLLGSDGPRTFLVQPMDRAELRATGGFTGQYGELTINQGRIAPFSMRNIALLEYTDKSANDGQLAPTAYRSWWPFANWGLRDSNLSADFPTAARLAIQLYKQETGHSVEGVVMMTPFAIEDVLKILGPISIPQYKETITAQNLEDKLHYYQLGPGINTQKEITHLTNDDEARKQFTSQLAHVLMDTVRHEPPQVLMQIGKQLLYDLKTRELQLYVQNDQVENMLVQYGYAGLLDRSTQHDGLYIVQANVSASKASQYVQTLVNDSVVLDQRGGATHTLKMQLVYHQRGSVYGLDTYRDYIRFYVPPGSVLRSGDGFDTGQPLCGGVLGACPESNVYPHNELVCPAGKYDAGYAAPMLNDPYTQEGHPLDNVGKPDNLHSDEPGRAMFGGYVVLPNDCTATVTLSWYVPPMAQVGYQLLLQRQAGTFPVYSVEIASPAVNGCSLAPLQRSATLQEDLLLSLNSTLLGPMTMRNCAASLLS